MGQTANRGFQFCFGYSEGGRGRSTAARSLPCSFIGIAISKAQVFVIASARPIFAAFGFLFLEIFRHPPKVTLSPSFVLPLSIFLIFLRISTIFALLTFVGFIFTSRPIYYCRYSYQACSPWQTQFKDRAGSDCRTADCFVACCFRVDTRPSHCLFGSQFQQVPFHHTPSICHP